MMENGLRSSFVLLAIVATAVGKPPPPPGAPWAKFVAKPAFARSLGPPPMSGFGTISVPYVTKPSMFPKFVDPRVMIAKKTDMLGNLFGGLGPVAPAPYGYGSMPYSGYNSESSPLDGAPTDSLEKMFESYGTLDDDAFAGSKDGFNAKRGVFGPKFPADGAFGPKSPKVGPLFGGDDSAPVAGSSPFYTRGIIGSQGPLPSSDGSTIPKNEKTDYLNKIFEAMDTTTDKADTDASSPPRSPPPYPGLNIISEESPITKTESKTSSSESLPKSSKNLLKRMVTDDGSSAAEPGVPKQYLPGMFGPGGPMFGPGGPAFGPGYPMFGPTYGPGPMFGPDAFMAKKSSFLDTLFKNLPSTTAAPVTDAPLPKSTIVPPEFWIPETGIPSPGAYTAKVSSFLEKLFDSLKLNASTVGGPPTRTATFEESISAEYPGSKLDVARAIDTGFGFDEKAPGGSAMDPLTIVTAKDQIVGSIINELAALKDNMMSTLDELIEYQKNATSPMMPGMKPTKPFVPPFWGAKPSIDAGTVMYKQRMVLLGQVFDMLTELQKNVSEAINDATKSTFATENPFAESQTTMSPEPDSTIFNLSLLDAIQAKLDDLKSSTTKLTPMPISAKKSRSVPFGPSSFWVAYPGDTAERRGIESTSGIGTDFSGTDKNSRAIQMKMHQGYQSLPPGTIESIQAGGGSVPGHEGGGIKLLGSSDYEDYLKWQEWKKTFAQEYRTDHHHGHH